MIVKVLNVRTEGGKPSESNAVMAKNLLLSPDQLQRLRAALDAAPKGPSVVEVGTSDCRCT